MHKKHLLINNLIIISISLSLLIWIAWTGGEEALALEHSHLAWLQSMMLIACAVTSANIAMLHRKHQLFWYILSSLLLFCALDERFMWHEHIQEYIYFQYLEPSAISIRWIQATTLVYAIGGVIVLTKLKLVSHLSTFRWLGTSVLIGCAAVVLDVLFDSLRIQAYEEILEYVAEVLFLNGLINELYKSQSYHYL